MSSLSWLLQLKYAVLQHQAKLLSRHVHVQWSSWLGDLFYDPLSLLSWIPIYLLATFSDTRSFCSFTAVEQILMTEHKASSQHISYRWHTLYIPHITYLVDYRSIIISHSERPPLTLSLFFFFYSHSSLTHRAEPFLRSCQLCNYSRTSQHFMEPEGSLPCSQEPSTVPYSEPDQSNPYHPILSL
jgi:hypothetical protein